MKRSPLPPESLSADSEHLHALLNEGTDTSVIVVAVSYIDACLASLLAKHLLQSSVTERLLDSRSGVIGSFVARSDLAYTLALVDKAMYQDLLVLAELRNETAHHHFELSFTSAEIVNHCEKLKYAASLKDSSSGTSLFEESWLLASRDRFILTAIMIVNRLLLTALGTTHVKRPA
jgi:DNA-binding MltR family transcriptional regulator